MVSAQVLWYKIVLTAKILAGLANAHSNMAEIYSRPDTNPVNLSMGQALNTRLVRLRH